MARSKVNGKFNQCQMLMMTEVAVDDILGKFKIFIKINIHTHYRVFLSSIKV